MLALSVLDSILTMDKFHQWMMFLSSKGYLQHLVDSVGADDEKLISVLSGNTENLKVLYLFESKVVCWLCLIFRSLDNSLNKNSNTPRL